MYHVGLSHKDGFVGLGKINIPNRGKGVKIMIKKNLFAAVAATAMAMTMSVSAFAADTTGTVGGVVPVDGGTDVYAGVVVDDPDTRIKVTVPTTFAFVVNGTAVEANKNDAITVASGALLLPNVKVVDGDKIATVGESVAKFENFSTKKGATNRIGVPVNVKGSITNEGTAASRNGWTAVGATPTAKKEYQLVVDNQAFVAQGANTYGMATAVAVAAPNADASNIDTTTQLAKAGTVKEVTFGVNVGGKRGDYNSAENSAKVGTISWTVSVNS